MMKSDRTKGVRNGDFVLDKNEDTRPGSTRGTDPGKGRNHKETESRSRWKGPFRRDYVWTRGSEKGEDLGLSW